MKKVFLLYIPFSIISLLIFSFYGIFSIYFVSNNSNEGYESEFDTFWYKIVQKDQQLDESSIGIVSLHELIEDGEYLFREYSDHEQAIITNFGSQIYECDGSCYCESDREETRRASSVKSLGQGLKYLLVASTTLFAVKKSQEYFDGKCQETYSDHCPTAIKSEVNSCDEEEEGEGFDLSKTIFAQEEDKPSVPLRFQCKGACMENSALRNKQAIEFMRQKKCDELSIHGVVQVDRFEGSTFSADDEVNEARQTFIRDSLGPYCNEMGKFTYTVKKLNHKAKSVDTQVNDSVCVNGKRIKPGDMFVLLENESVVCVRG